jgi:dCMP deaminase
MDEYYSVSNWDFRWLDLAKLISKWSKDPSTKVGAVIVKNNKELVSLGYNGFPKKIADDERLLDRETKLKIIIHAEQNAFNNADREDIKGSTLYTFPFMPCSRCCAQAIELGVERIVAPKNENPRWVESFSLTRKMCEEANVCLIEI